MLNTLKGACIALILASVPTPSESESPMSRNLLTETQENWRFLTDGVMGGVSTGGSTFLNEGETQFARMTGRVSTENNGGFIQMRLGVRSVPEDAKGVRLLVRGNGEQYFVHLRTSGTVLPWQFYQAGFETTAEWAEVRLPLENFKPSGGLLRSVPKASSIKSVGLVAYGRDHEAQLDVREVGFF